jgi:crotonobetainyl-CoA:carnitine CoA-transferase CaiB-like acyl-CoA transferase
MSSTPTNGARPFTGVRVLDLTHVLAGPFCTYQLATLGADVVKIEPPHRPDMTRAEGVLPEQNEELYGTYFQAQNAGKRAITRDLRDQRGRAVLHRPLEGADVLVQNYAGGAAERLGIGYDDLEPLNPRLIYCSLSGFGRTGPEADHPAYDVTIQAFSGLMATNGAPEDGPVRVGPPMVGYGMGAQAAFSIAAALFQREQTGRGQFIDVAMLDSAFMLMTAMVTDTLTSGAAPARHGNEHPYYAGYRLYETADGPLVIGAYTNEQLARLLETLGEPERADAVRQTSRAEIRASTESDAELIAARVRTRGADEWEALLQAAHVPAARVRTLDEALAHEQVASRAVVQPMPVEAESGPSALPAAGFSTRHGATSLGRVPPRFGEHTDEILGEAGYTEGKIAELRGAGVI